MSCHGTGTIAVVDDSQCQGCPGSTDWSDCIINTMASLGTGGTLQFKRGKEYVVNSQLLIDAVGMTWEATGTGQRPIIRFVQSPSGGGVLVKKADVTLSNLDIRGPYYNQGNRDGGARYGINAARSLNEPTSDRLHISGVSVNGFGDHGLLVNGELSGLTVQNSQFRYNGGSGLALFPDLPDLNVPVGVNIQGNQLSDNGEDGIDSVASSVTISANSISGNGWANPEGLHEGHGVLLNAAGAGADVSFVLITNNNINSNWRNGIHLHDPDQWKYEGVEIKNNYILSNGTEQFPNWGWGVAIHGMISNSSLDANDAFDNHSGCYSLPSTGISVGNNCCNGQGGPGPGGSMCLE
jgi:parallel beta-helix repeat protein